MTSAELDKRVLWRASTETARMNYQHNLWMRNFGYFFHPSITSELDPFAAVADIGTGTGIFLTELSTQLPSTTSFYGFDIHDACFPRASDLPTNVSLHIGNAKEPFPEGWHGGFDAVYLRFLVSALKDEEEWVTVAKNIFQILKPGGAIQWCEIDSGAMKILRDTPGAKTSACNFVLGEIKALSSGKPGIQGLGKTFRVVGFEDVEEDWVASDRWPETRKDYILKSLGLWGNILRLRDTGEGVKRTGQEIEGIIKQVEDEVDSGAYWRVDVCTFIGFKPKSV